jgi:hypothetical protein
MGLDNLAHPFLAEQCQRRRGVTIRRPYLDQSIGE